MLIYTSGLSSISLYLSGPLQISALSPAVTLSCCHSLISLMQSYNVWQNFVPAPGVAINVVCCWLLTIREAAHRNLNLTSFALLRSRWGSTFRPNFSPKRILGTRAPLQNIRQGYRRILFWRTSSPCNPIKSNPIQSSPISHPPNKTLIQRAHD